MPIDLLLLFNTNINNKAAQSDGLYGVLVLVQVHRSSSSQAAVCQDTSLMIQNKADDEKCASQDAGSEYEKLVIYVFYLIFFVNILESLYLFSNGSAENIISSLLFAKSGTTNMCSWCFFKLPFVNV